MSILNREEIEYENNRMYLESNTLISLISYPPNLSNTLLKDLILSDPLPEFDIDINILNNRNLKNISPNVEINKGILINRSSLRYLPTKSAFYSDIIVEENIATELSFATPILILHTSLDNEWHYIQSYFYKGWIYKNDVSIVDDATFFKFLSPNEFVIITTNQLIMNEITLDMGIKLPLLAQHSAFYEVLIPNANGCEIAVIDTNNANIGYLDYTEENIIIQANKYLDTPYKWGGIENGIDCSLLIVNIFKTFGFIFPRDAKEQEKVVGLQNISLKGQTEEEKKTTLDFLLTPFILYKKGHVLLGLGNNKVLHAYGDAEKVIISDIDNSYGTNLYHHLTSVASLHKSL
jgi:Cell wall-associated hydrolases (invasion-associated proteins)